MKLQCILRGGLLFLLMLPTSCADFAGLGGEERTPAVNENESFDANSASKVASSSFNVSSVRKLLDWEFMDMLADTAEFTYDYYDSALPDETDACFDGKLGAYRFVRNSRNSFTLSVEDTDVKACYDSGLERYTVSILLEDMLMKDLEGNMVDLTGMSLADTFSLWLVQFRMRYFIEVAGTSPDGTSVRIVYREATHASTLFGEPCGNEGADACITESVEVVRYPDDPAYDFVDKIVIESHSLGIVPGAPYYAGGAFTFQFNNWSGTLTYADSAFVPPTYTATNGINTVSGTYIPLAPALGVETLKGAIKSGMLKAVRRAALKRRETP